SSTFITSCRGSEGCSPARKARILTCRNRSATSPPKTTGRDDACGRLYERAVSQFVRRHRSAAFRRKKQRFKRIPMIEPIKFFTDKFNITIPQIEALLGAALSKGGEYADLYFEYNVLNNLSLEEQIIKSANRAVKQ